MRTSLRIFENLSSREIFRAILCLLCFAIGFAASSQMTGLASEQSQAAAKTEKASDTKEGPGQENEFPQRWRIPHFWSGAFFEPFESSFFREFLAGDFYPDCMASTSNAHFIPRLNSSESGDELKLSVELPGISQKDLDIKITDEAVTIAGEKQQEEMQKSANGFNRIERSYGKFKRTICFPSRIDPDKASALLKNGVLEIVAPKSKLAQAAPRKLDIKTEI